MKLFIAIDKIDFQSAPILRIVVMHQRFDAPIFKSQFAIEYSVRMFIIECDYFHSLIDSSHIHFHLSIRSNCAINIQY